MYANDNILTIKGITENLQKEIDRIHNKSNKQSIEEQIKSIVKLVKESEKNE